MPSSTSPDFLRILPSEMEAELIRILIRYKFSGDQAKICAGVITGNSVDGVYSHGVNRFAKFIKYVKDGLVKSDKEAICINSVGSIEQWDGQSGAGPINALRCTTRAMEIASKQGIGFVALAHTNHWLRGGTYGWKAAKSGFAFIGWSNTIANMPAWGATNPKLGNNPLVIALPFQNEAIVLDMALSQYSYGAMELYEMKNELLPVPGGYDTNGELTNSPAAIKKSQRTLPIGYWKGAGLSMLLDILATVFSGGLSTAEVTVQNVECNLSQIFIAIDISKLKNYKSIATALDQILADYRQSIPEQPGKKIRYPGEQVLAIRAENTAQGIPVLKKVWDEIKSL